MISPQRCSPPSPLRKFYSLLGCLGLMWGLELIDALLPLPLDQFGIHPRSLSGLIGIAVSPFLHGSWSHLMANTPPLLIFGGLISFGGATEFWLVTLGCGLISGLGTWAFSPSYTVTVGASGIVFGYFGYLLLRGFFERKFSSIAISLVIGFVYGGIIWQAFPSSDARISWTAHFFGLIGGVLLARFLGSSKRLNDPYNRY